MTAPKTEWIKCIHMTAEMARNCPTCNPSMLGHMPRPDLQLPPPVGYTLTAEVEAMIREARQEERDACLAIIEDMKSDAAITAAARARYTAMQASNASFNECRHRIRGRSRGAE